MKCNVCGERVSENDKFCSNCGQTLKKENSYASQDNNTSINNNLAFATCGDVFEIGHDVVVLGIAVRPLKIGDCLVLEDEMYQIQGIDLFRRKVNEVEAGKNCALNFGRVGKKYLHQKIMEKAAREQDKNTPINFSTRPTTLYTFFSIK